MFASMNDRPKIVDCLDEMENQSFQGLADYNPQEDFNFPQYRPQRAGTIAGKRAPGAAPEQQNAEEKIAERKGDGQMDIQVYDAKKESKQGISGYD